MQTLEAGSDVQRKRKSNRKSKRRRRSHIERKSKQNEIRTRILVSQDGGNLVPRVRVSLDHQSLNEDSVFSSWFERKP